MNQKSLFLATALIALLVIAGAFWLMQKRQVPTIPSVVTDSAVETPVQQANSVTEGAPDKQTFVTDVDPDVSHWQTKETEFFTIKFPKEWYWLESVITNNPNFPIADNREIGIFSGGIYPLLLEDKTEVVISFNGSATSDAGTPQESIDSAFRLAKKNHPSVDCSQLSRPNIVPVRAYCSFIDTAIKFPQKVQMYYIANKLHTISFSALATETTTVPKSILDKIAASMVVKETW